jgi:arylsulfatase A-like enzyme
MHTASSCIGGSGRDQRRVVCILVDGACHQVLRDLLDRGDLPNLASWVIEPGGLAVGTTVFPSTTGVAYIPILFGRYPGPANVPGIRWLDRAGIASGVWERWRAARSYCGAQAGWINHDVDGGPSIFELVPQSLAICTPITRGLFHGAHLMPMRRAILGVAAHYLGNYLALDRAVADTWLAAAERPWRFLFVVFPGPDGLTHLHDPRHPRVLAAYRQIDRALGAFIHRVRRRGEVPTFFVVADHGASVVRAHQDLALALEAWGIPTIRHPMHVWRRHARAAVMVSGNACAHVYLLDGAGRQTDLVERLLALPSVALGAYRDGEGGVIVARGNLRARLEKSAAGITYKPLTGDPLGLSRWPVTRDDRALLEQSRTSPFPDAPCQLLQLLSSARSGDLVLAAAPGFDFRGPWELPAHRSGHGSLTPEHMLVPIAASVPLPAAPLRTADLLPTMLETLGVPVPPGLDGIPFSGLAARTGASV